MPDVGLDTLNAKILIVDDQEGSVLLLKELLEHAGYTRISSTVNPREACRLHRDNRYDLILLDLEMPGMDGFEVMESLKTITTEEYLPVLVITGSPEHKVRALRAGAKDFISKPFDPTELFLRIHNMLEVRLLHKAARKYSEDLVALALKDPLTGLANRRLLSDRMSMGILHAKRHKSVMAVLFLDLDGFKQVNDTLGHGTGDGLLKMVAARLVATVREEDTVARLGGDEFIVALWHVKSADYVYAVASKVIEAIARPYVIEGHALTLTASAGVAIYPTHGEDEGTLLRSADLALYEAKRAGKNEYRVATVGASNRRRGSQRPRVPPEENGARPPVLKH